MPNLRRIPYTKPIPPGAQIFTRKGQRFARFKSRGKTAEAPLNEDGTRIRLLSKKWYGEYVDADDRVQCVPLSTNETAAGLMLAELVRKAELKKANVTDPFEEHRKRPLTEHLADWEADLKARGTSPDQIAQATGRVRRLIDGCGFTFIADLSPSRVQQFLADLQTDKPLPPLEPGKEWFNRKEVAAAVGILPESVKTHVRRRRLPSVGNGRGRLYPRATVEALRSYASRGPGVQTANYYLREVKSFCRWLVKDRRMPDNPLAHLQGGNPRLDRRHDRQTLAEAQLRAVLDAALASPRAFGPLAGRDRYFLYLAAMYTGFRAGEVAELVPESFDLDAAPPVVALPARVSKNRRGATQPLPPAVAAALRGYLAGRPAGQPVWPGNWWDRAAEMLRLDLEAAGVPYEVQGPDGPLFADFHSLRHSYIALLDKSGATLKEAMQLARHSDPKLTMARYGRAQLHDLGEAVGRMPVLLPPGQGAAAAVGESLRPACAAGDGRGRPLRVADGGEADGDTTATVRKTQSFPAPDGGGGPLTAADGEEGHSPLTPQIFGCGSHRPR